MDNSYILKGRFYFEYNHVPYREIYILINIRLLM